MRVVLFDVDGTLLLTGGAGSRALSRALRQIYGIANGMQGVRPDGKTDPQIVREALGRLGRRGGVESETLGTLFECYTDFLREEMAHCEGFRVLPGVPEILSTLHQCDGYLLGLATGNIRSGARLKLEKAGLSSFFRLGAFGCDAEDRTRLIEVAVIRAREWAESEDVQEVFVIGDTPRDIVHGREAGARTVAVASGSYSLEELSAYRPDLAVGSLAPPGEVLEFLGVTQMNG